MDFPSQDTTMTGRLPVDTTRDDVCGGYVDHDDACQKLYQEGA